MLEQRTTLVQISTTKDFGEVKSEIIQDTSLIHNYIGQTVVENPTLLKWNSLFYLN